MNNQFDNRLTQKIRETFEQYDDGQADQGWRELRKKYPVKAERKPALYYWLGSAAALLILGLGVWALSQQEPQQASQTATMQSDKSIKYPEKQETQIMEDTPGKTGKPHLPEKQLAAVSPKKHTAGQTQAVRTTSGDEKDKKTLIAMAAETVENNQSSALNTPETDFPATDSASMPEHNYHANGSTPAIAKVDKQPATQSSLPDILSTIPEEKNNNKKDSKLTFSVYAGSFISYAEGSSNKINLGAGFSSNIALTDKLRLSAGIALSQNNLSFSSNHIPAVAENSFKSAFNKSPEGFTSSMKVLSYNLEGYDASLLGLDIPVNLTYMLSEKKNDLFISAGISSGTFLNESYTYHYSSYGSSDVKLADTNGPVNNKDEVQNDVGSFDFARMLNFSFGVGYPIGRNKLIVEPFVKYPLKGIGQENLRFGAGGINLKLNFKTSK